MAPKQLPCPTQKSRGWLQVAATYSGTKLRGHQTVVGLLARRALHLPKPGSQKTGKCNPMDNATFIENQCLKSLVSYSVDELRQAGIALPKSATTIVAHSHAAPTDPQAPLHHEGWAYSGKKSSSTAGPIATTTPSENDACSSSG